MSDLNLETSRLIFKRNGIISTPMETQRSLSVLTFSNEILSPCKATDLNPGFDKVFNERSEKNLKPRKKRYAIIYFMYQGTARFP
jgi:hypothetical protein